MPAIEDVLPSLLDEDGSADEDADMQEATSVPADTILGLPSDFSRSERSAHGFDSLAGFELKIRIGLAFDLLDTIRLAVQHRAAQLEHKKKHVRTNKANAVAEEHIKQADLRAKHLALKYNANYDRILALRPQDYAADDDKGAGGRLQRIDLSVDLTIANMAAARTQGDSRRTGSWIWSVFEHKEPYSWTFVAEMVQWFRARAAKDRADEAVNKICAEFRRTCQGYGAYARLWQQAAQEESRPAGERAYAYKTGAMWARMHKLCEEQYDASRRPGVEAGRLDQTRVRAVSLYDWDKADRDLWAVHAAVLTPTTQWSPRSL
ncbi:hypothetical protein BV20DRAFT_959341 [Pilatotrama ljubarskyi]|nr:hypothetical protein BV20DRAFT_959341 [Pilatotrama ljubarskyi]